MYNQKNQMWIFYGCVITFVVGFVTAGDDITVTCGSCDGGGSELKGDVGGNLTIIYSINTPTFVMLKISINGTNIINMLSSGKVNILGNIDKRFSVPKKLTVNGNTRSVNITLTKLRLTDDGLVFKYTYTDSDGNDFPGENKLKVSAFPTLVDPSSWKTVHDVNEGNNETITLTLIGNPQPAVTATMENQPIKVITTEGLGPHTYNYAATLENANRSQCGKNMTLTAVGYQNQTSPFVTEINVRFTPSPPKNVSARFNFTKCLNVSWKEIESGDCIVLYTVKYKWAIYNTTTYNTTTYNTTNLLNYHECFSFNASTNDTVSIMAAVGGRSSNFSNPVRVIVETSTTTTTTTTKPTATTTTKDAKSVKGQGGKTFEWWIILIIVIAVLILAAFVICVLVCIGIISCECCKCSCKEKGKRQSRTKPTNDEERRVMKAKSSKGDTYFTVVFQNIHSRAAKLIWKDFNGGESSCQEIDSKKDHMKSACITYSFIARDSIDNQLLYFTDNNKTDVIYEGLKFGAKKAETYNIIITSKPSEVKQVNGTNNQQYQGEIVDMKPVEGDYAEVSTIMKPRQQPLDQMDYAELGPGGRTGEKPSVQQSNYAQVNIDGTYYPPLNPHNEQPPLYAVSNKAKMPTNPHSTKERSSRPPSDYDDGNSIVV